MLCKYCHTQTIVRLAFCLLQFCFLSMYYTHMFILPLKFLLTKRYNYVIFLWKHHFGGNICYVVYPFWFFFFHLCCILNFSQVSLLSCGGCLKFPTWSTLHCLKAHVTSQVHDVTSIILLLLIFNDKFNFLVSQQVCITYFSHSTYFIFKI